MSHSAGTVESAITFSGLPLLKAVKGDRDADLSFF